MSTRLLGSLIVLTAFVAVPSAAGLTPARDLRGTWVSALSGQGYKISGRLDVAGTGTARLDERGDIRLVVKTMKGNRLSGTITLSLRESVTTVTVKTAKGSRTYPPQRIPVSGAGVTRQFVATASGTRIDFQSMSFNGAVVSLHGSFTSNHMSGTMMKRYAGTSGAPGLEGTLMRPMTGTFTLYRHFNS